MNSDQRNHMAQRLRAADPAASEPLSHEEVAALRQHLRGLALQRPPRPATGSWSFALAGALVALLALVVGMPRPVAPPAASPAAGATAAAEPTHPQQLHLVTPGGTRIVWVLNSNLSLGRSDHSSQ